MAIDPSIPLGVRPPQIDINIPSPLQRQAQFMSLRAMMEQSQLRNLQMQQERMQMDAAQQAQAADTEFRRRIGAGETLTPTQTLGILGPTKGAAFLKNQFDYNEAQHKAQISRANRLGSIIGSATDTPSYNRAVMLAQSEGYYDPETARQLMSEGYNADKVAQYRRQAMTAEQQASSALAQAQAKRQEAESAMKLRREGLEYAAQTVPNEPGEWVDWRAQLPEETRPLIPLFHSPAALELVQRYGVKPTAAVPGRDVPYSPDVLKQKVEIATAAAPRMPTVGMTPEAEEQAIRIAGARQAGKPPTAAQETVATYAQRMKQAENNLEKIQQGLTERIWNKLTPSWANTTEGQVFAQAERNFINSVLRRESGAVISPSEFTEARQQYIPQPGDSAEVLKSKRDNRRLVQESFKRAAGKAYIDPDELLRQAGTETAQKPIVQRSPSTGQYRHSIDGGKTWRPGRPTQ